MNNGLIRQAILRRMGELGYSTYKVAQLVKGKMCQATVYNFIEGETDIASDRLSSLMEVLQLTITVGS